MKKEVTREVTVCDECGKTCYESCLGCGADHCDDHKKELGVEYQYAVYLSGAGNGYYCLGCDARLRVSGDDPLHSAYLTIKTLIDEINAFRTDFDKRAWKVRTRLEALREARGREENGPILARASNN